MATETGTEYFLKSVHNLFYYFSLLVISRVCFSLPMSLQLLGPYLPFIQINHASGLRDDCLEYSSSWYIIHFRLYFFRQPMSICVSFKLCFAYDCSWINYGMTFYCTAVLCIIKLLGNNSMFISESRTVPCKIIYTYVNKNYRFLYLFFI